MVEKGAAFDWAERFRTLVRVGKAINSTLELEPTLSAILVEVGAAMNAEGASIFLLEGGGKSVRVVAAVGEKAAEALEIRLQPGEGIAGWVISRGQPALVALAEEDPRHQKEISHRIGLPCRSILAVPVKDRGTVIGALEVLNPRAKERFGRQDQELLESLATQVAIAVRNATSYTALERENNRLRHEIGLDREVVGDHPAIGRAMALVERAAPFDVSVLITGESGTGKELFARAIHQRSPRAAGPFIDVNCTAMPDTLLESELFGHEKGAFTGAVAGRRGKFEQANGGTLFLDEVGDMSYEAQSKLLRALEERTFVPVGGEKPVRVDLRVVAATNRRIEEEVRDGRFREDLYFRLNEFPIHLAPLRARREDIVLLARHFLEKFSQEFGRPLSGWDPEALRLLAVQPWPGNVRELRNVVKSAIILAEGETVGVEALPERFRGGPPAPPPAVGEPEELLPLAEVEKRYLAQVMESVGWNKSRAARVLGISRPTVDAKLKAYGIQPS
jgi:Nif-specific regulatory protein